MPWSLIGLLVALAATYLPLAAPLGEVALQLGAGTLASGLLWIGWRRHSVGFESVLVMQHVGIRLKTHFRRYAQRATRPVSELGLRSIGGLGAFRVIGVYGLWATGECEYGGWRCFVPGSLVCLGPMSSRFRLVYLHAGRVKNGGANEASLWTASQECLADTVHAAVVLRAPASSSGRP